jgi:glycerophosphoryl diester phosphodiesterase
VYHLNRTFIWGHRGSGFIGVQNTFPSFQNAINMGVDGIKTEAQLSKDNEIVLSFYKSLKINGEELLMNKLDLDEIKKFKLENNESIPSLRELFENFKNYNIRYNFDITVPEIGIEIIKLAREFDLVDYIELGKPSIYPDPLPVIFSKIRKFDKNVTLVNSVSLKHTNINEEHLELKNMRELDIKVINIYHNYSNFELFKLVKDHGFKYYVWGVLFKRSFEKFLKMRYNGEYIDAIMSNLPDRLIEMRNKIQVLNQ